MAEKLELATLGVRAGQVRSQFQEHSEALYLTSSYVFENAAEAAARFGGSADGMVYTRYTNPTVAMFQDRLAALEGAESCVATSSGMAAILATAMVHLKAGDHVVCSKALFGATMTVFLRTAGPAISPFNAWVLLKGLETLDLRIRAQSAAALELARWLEGHPSVARVHYPGLASHPQHELAKRQQRAAGSVLSFEVKGGRAAAWRVIDSTRMISITANLGDVKSTIIHPASTTHGRISAEARAAAGVTEGLVRIAVGLEAVADLQADLERGLT